MDFCEERGVDLNAILKADGFQKVAYLEDAASNLVDKQIEEAVDDAVEQVIVNDDLKKEYITLANRVIRLYKAILPDPLANEFAPIKACLSVLADKIRSFVEEATIEEIMDQVDDLLDESIATRGFVIHATEQTTLIDLSQIDFEALKAHFEKGRKRTQVEKLRQAVGDKLQHMVALNKTRTDFLEKFKKLIEEYNKGMDLEGFFAKLTDFVKELSKEDKRAVSEQLTEEELALFDILTKPEIDMTKDEKEEVKKVARMLLQTLKEAKLVLDWRKNSDPVQMFTQLSKPFWMNSLVLTRLNSTARSAIRSISTFTTVIRAKAKASTLLHDVSNWRDPTSPRTIPDRPRKISWQMDHLGPSGHPRAVWGRQIGDVAYPAKNHQIGYVFKSLKLDTNNGHKKSHKPLWFMALEVGNTGLEPVTSTV
ncbi:MAG: DUF3387 domain-containing protein [Planctomycetaceae bacterium]